MRALSRGAALTIFATIVLPASSGGAPVMYTVRDLGGASGDFSEAEAVNNSVQVAGYKIVDGYGDLAFRYDNGLTRNVGAFLGESRAYAINGSGVVVGTGQNGPSLPYYAFTWDTTRGFQTLGTLGGPTSIAYGINDSGQVVGQSDTSSSSPHAFLYSNGRMQDLGFSGIAYAINNLGQVVGQYDTGSGSHAYLDSNGIMQDLGTLAPGKNSSARSINDSGQVVGIATNANGLPRGFLYSGNGPMQALGVLPGAFAGESEALAINAPGQIVGDATVANGVIHAVIFNGTTPVDLNDVIGTNSGFRVLVEATDINDQGQIVGYGYVTGGTIHAFLLTPIAEPASIVMASLGLVAVAGVALRRRRAA